MKGKIVAAALALALVVGVAPVPALAEDLAAGSADTAREQVPSQPEASSGVKTVYVLTGIKLKEKGHVVATSKFTYKKNGLLAKRASKGPTEKTTTTWKYDKSNRVKKLKKTFYRRADTSSKMIRSRADVTKFSYGSSGRMKSYVWNRNDYRVDYSSWVKRIKAKFKYGTKTERREDGEVVQELITVSNKYYDGQKKPRRIPIRYYGDTHYTLEDGRVVGFEDKYDGYGCEYDAKGNLKNISNATAKNTYNGKGLLVKRVAKSFKTKQVFTYKYKAVKVKASIADKVEAQRWALVNENKNLVLGLGELEDINRDDDPCAIKRDFTDYAEFNSAFEVYSFYE